MTNDQKSESQLWGQLDLQGQDAWFKIASLHIELADLLARARREGWYENDPGWQQVDGLLTTLGLDVGEYDRSR